MKYKLGDTLASIRVRKRIDQKSAATFINISVSYLSQIENNRRRPTGKVLYAMCILYETPLSDVLYEAIGSPDYELYCRAKPMIDKILKMLLSHRIAE